MISRIMTLFFLLMAIAAMYFFVPRHFKAPIVDNAPITNDFYLKEFSFTSYDRTGKKSHIVNGSVLEQASDSKELTVHSPLLLLEDEKQGVWKLTAATGEMDAAMQNARLVGDVQLLRKENPLSKLVTPELDLDLAARIATSNSGVVISQGENRIESTAMSADLSRETFKLSTAVRGVYVP